MLSKYQCGEKTKALNSLYSEYDIEVRACETILLPEQMIDADIVICLASSFNKNVIEVKEIMKLNPKSWFVVLSFDNSNLLQAKNNGCKHRLRGYVEVTPIEEIFYAIHLWYRPNVSMSIMEGAGFNQQVGLHPNIEIQTSGELSSNSLWKNDMPMQISCNEKGVFVNKIRIKSVSYNTIQLKFLFEQPKRIKLHESEVWPHEWESYIIFSDHNSSSKEIERIFLEVEPFLIVNR